MPAYEGIEVLKAQDIRVALADDQTVVAEGLGYILERYGFDLVGISFSGLGAIELVKREKPDVLVLDLMMPDMDGFAVAEALARGSSDVKVIILTASKKPHDAVRAMNLGVSGYLVKDTDSERLCEIIMMVARGSHAVDPEFVDAIFSWDMDKMAKRDFGLVDPLTEQQTRVLAMISAGLSNDEIAALLSISENTVKTHVRLIYQKIMVTDRANAVIWAYQHGIAPMIQISPS